MPSLWSESCAPRARRCAPQIEPLEDRFAPAIFPVSNTADSGGGSLRQAILEANAAPGDDLITFNPSVTGTITLLGELPQLSTNIDLRGPGASTLTVKRDTAASDFRIFTIGAGATVSITGLTITNGKAFHGGGILNLGNLTVRDSHITGNTATGAGGGIANGAPSLSGTPDLLVINSTVSANTAGGTFVGGGIHSAAGSMWVSSSTISGNSARGAGGIGVYGGNSMVTHSTITGNTGAMPDDGGGIDANGDSPLVLYNTIVAGNLGTTNDVVGDFASSGHNLIGKAGITATGLIAGDLVGTSAAPRDAKLGPLQNNGGPTPTHALLDDSPAIDAGDDRNAPQSDQRGRPRIAESHIDIGSVEQHALPAVATALDITVSSTTPAPGAPVTVTVHVRPAATGGATPTGSVNFAINGGTPTTVGVTDGFAVLTLPGGLSQGFHWVQAAYSGDVGHLASISPPVLLSVGIPPPGTVTMTFFTFASSPVPGSDVTAQLTLNGVFAFNPIRGGFKPTKRGRWRRVFVLRNEGPALNGVLRFVPRNLPRGYRWLGPPVAITGLATGQSVLIVVELKATAAAIFAGRLPGFTPTFVLT